VAKIQIMVGPKRRLVDVNAWPFLPGLYAHSDYGGSDDGLYSVTHVESKLRIISNVPESELELVRSILGKLLWDIPARKIYENTRYYKAIKEAKSVLTNQQRSEKQEERISKDLKGKRQPASGSRWGYKRDVVTPVFLLEAKTTKSKTHSVPFNDLEFIRRQAYATGRIPVYLVSLLDSCEVAILPEQDVGVEDIPDDTPQKELVYKSAAKSMSINMEVVKYCIKGGVVNATHGKNKFIIMGYEMFLNFAKKGVE